MLAKSFHASSYDIKYYVQSWLEGSNSQSLVTKLTTSLKEFKIAKYSKILDEIDKLNIKTDTEQAVKMENNGECSWVPAAFCFNDDAIRKTKIYGGVNLGLNMVQGNGGSGGKTYRIFSARELIRSGEERSHSGRAGVKNFAHNFPAAYMNDIFNGQKTIVSPTYHVYKQPGVVEYYKLPTRGRNGYSTVAHGVYEIGVRPHVTKQGNVIEVITHYHFKPEKKYRK